MSKKKKMKEEAAAAKEQQQAENEQLSEAENASEDGRNSESTISEETKQENTDAENLNSENTPKPEKTKKKKKPFYKKWWFWLLVIIVIIIIICIIAGNSGNKDSDKAEDSVVAEETSADVSENETTEETEEEGIDFISVLTLQGVFDETTYTGSGDDVITLENSGYPALMYITYTGESNFIVYTVDSSGETVDLLVNDIGSYSGIVTDYTDYEDVTMLSIESSGDWSITVKPLNSMEELVNGASYTGDGVYYIDTEELTTLTITNTGDSNFIVYGIGMDDSGLLVNEIGEYSGTVLWTESQCFLIIQSEGTWTVSW